MNAFGEIVFLLTQFRTAGTALLLLRVLDGFYQRWRYGSEIEAALFVKRRLQWLIGHIRPAFQHPCQDFNWLSLGSVPILVFYLPSARNIITATNQDRHGWKRERELFYLLRRGRD
jgi:hypothetical protein